MSSFTLFILSIKIIITLSNGVQIKSVFTVAFSYDEIYYNTRPYWIWFKVALCNCQLVLYVYIVVTYYVAYVVLWRLKHVLYVLD